MASKYRYFNGQEYEFLRWVRLKAEAMEAKKYLKGRGGFVRIEKLKHGYNIWLRR